MKLTKILFLAAMLCAVPIAASAQHVSAASQFQIERGVVQHPTNLATPSTDPADDLANVRARIMSEARTTAFTADGEVQVPYGDWIATLLHSLLAFAAAVAAAVLARVSPNIREYLDMGARMAGQRSANELLEKAIGYGINTTEGAVHGKVLTVKVGNEVLERAFEYAVRHAPGLVATMGGLAQVREKIIARLDLEPAAAIPSPRPPATQLIAEASSATPAAS